jgi:thiol-disulfide isomerase/thioredoxin
MTNAKKAKRQRRDNRPQQRRSGTRNTWLALAALASVLVIVAVVLSSGGGSSATPGAITDLVDPARVSIDRAAGAALQPGEDLPAFSAPSLDGNGSVAWSTFEGSPAVIAIWAPWCPHCQVELPRLASALQDHPSVRLVTIVTAIGQEPGPQPEQYMSDESLSFPVAVDDTDLSLLNGMGVQSFPTTYYVGSYG